MKNLTKRILTVLIGVPVVFSIIIFLPQYNHLAYCIVIEAITVISCFELKKLVNKKVHISILPLLFGSLFPLIEWLELTYFYKRVNNLVLISLISFVVVLFLYETIKGGKDDFKSSLYRISSSILTLIYPGLFMSYMIKLPFFYGGESNTRFGGLCTALILLYVGTVFASDIFAYIFGMLFGKGNRGIIKCSPNKSIVGFIGGTVFPALLSTLLPILLPDYYNIEFYKIALVVFFTSIFSTSGDLFESMLKRSCDTKDSGHLIPGRGGMLDCIDSISVGIPIFIFLGEVFGLIW